MWWLIIHLLGKGAEYPVPDDEGHAHVLIKIRGIAGMMHTVVRRGNEYIFYPAGQFFDRLCMHQYTIGLCQCIHEQDIYRVEAY